MTHKIDSALIQAFESGGFGLAYTVENQSEDPPTAGNTLRTIIHPP